MLKKLNDFLAGLPMTIVAGVFLLLDLVPHLMEEFGGEVVQLSFLPFDPAWVTIIISGIPLLYLAIWRVIYNPGISKISSALLICIAMFAAIGIGDLFAAGEVAFIMAIGAILEDMTTERAKKGLKKLNGPCNPIGSTTISTNQTPPELPGTKPSTKEYAWLQLHM